MIATTDRLYGSSERVWKHLRQNALGAGKSIPAPRIAETLGIPDTKQDNAIRQICRKLNEAGYPVVGGSKGFFVATSQQELDDYESSLRRRGAKDIERADVIATLEPWDEAESSENPEK